MGEGIRRRVTTAPGIELDVIDAGTPGDPVIVLVHGWPESSHSWRHQIDPLVAAGYRVLVPDQRGYAASSAPRLVEAYRSDHLAADLCALLDDIDAPTATFVGHDWGSLVVWDLARFQPERVNAVINVSVPYTPWPIKPTDLFRSVYGDRFFYMLYFQQTDAPERELEADIELSMRTILWGGSAEMFGPAPDPSKLPSLAHGTLLGTFTHGHVGPEALVELLRVAATGAQFALGVNAEHYDERGFAAHLGLLAEAGLIDDVTTEQVRIYHGGDDEHADDLALVVLFTTR